MIVPAISCAEHKSGLSGNKADYEKQKTKPYGYWLTWLTGGIIYMGKVQSEGLEGGGGCPDSKGGVY